MFDYYAIKTEDMTGPEELFGIIGNFLQDFEVGRVTGAPPSSSATRSRCPCSPCATDFAPPQKARADIRKEREAARRAEEQEAAKVGLSFGSLDSAPFALATLRQRSCPIGPTFFFQIANLKKQESRRKRKTVLMTGDDERGVVDELMQNLRTGNHLNQTRPRRRRRVRGAAASTSSTDPTSSILSLESLGRDGGRGVAARERERVAREGARRERPRREGPRRVGRC